MRCAARPRRAQGVFAPPAAVFCDFALLDPLSDRVWRSGVAEAFKVGCIKDAAFLDALIAAAPALHRRERAAGEAMVLRAAELHLAHIATSGDPFEQGTSRPLDFGHWSAHRLESLTEFDLLHGEAVAIGVALDLHVAALLNYVTLADARRVVAAMATVGLPVWHPFLRERFGDLRRGLEEFREHLGGRLTLAMPRPLGRQEDIAALGEPLLRQAVGLLEEVAAVAAAAGA